MKKWREIRHLIFRNIFVLVNIIVFSVAILLLSFGDIKEGVFLGLILVINTIVSLVRDIHTWLTLERLQILTAVRVTRINDKNTEDLIFSDDIKIGDKIKLKLGDQVPCDGELVSVYGLEVNEGVLTGESNSFQKKVGETVYAGSIITSGNAILLIKTAFNQSRIAKMTGNIKRYSNSTSPIQDSVNMIVRYSGYVLFIIIPFVIYRGLGTKESAVVIVKNIGAVASMTVPQGLFMATTLMFVYGAIYSFRRNVLLQDINASEKFGRIKNLCIDKTGTLTENTLTVEDIYIPDKVQVDEARKLSLIYTLRSGDLSETIFAIRKYLGNKYSEEIVEAMPFSASRRYGAVLLGGEYKDVVVLAGAPEAFIENLSTTQEKQWIKNIIESRTHTGHRVMCFVRYFGKEIPREFSVHKFSILAVFVLHNNLRKGIVEAINFFQDRGILMRVISGDNPETVKVISALAGIKGVEKVITGPEMESWSESDWNNKISTYNIFARIKPEQKERIVEILKKDGFTAMVGDGANDALAIKKADLGIAMFDGAQATRQLASVVLMNNSFSELPAGVKLADNVIENIEIFAGIFLNQTFLGFLLFLFISVFGYSYPFTPLNITFINYFTVGIPSLLIFYWLTHPREINNIVNKDTFLKRVVPFPLISSIPQFFGIVVLFIILNKYFKDIVVTTPISLFFISVGMIFFFAIQRIHKTIDKKRLANLIFLVFVEFAVLIFGFSVPFFNDVYNIVPPSWAIIGLISLVTLIFIFIQYLVTELFVRKKV